MPVTMDRPSRPAYCTSQTADLRRRSQSRSSSSDSDDSAGLESIQGVDSRPPWRIRGHRPHFGNHRRPSPSPHSQRVPGEDVAIPSSHIPPRANQHISPSSFASHGRNPDRFFEDPVSRHHGSSLPSTRDGDSAYFEGRTGARDPLEDEVERMRKDIKQLQVTSKKDKERRKKAEKRAERQSADLDRMYSVLRELDHKVQSLTETSILPRNWNNGSLGHSRQDDDPYTWPEEPKGGATHPQRQGAEPDALCPVPDRLSAAIRSQMKTIISETTQGPLATVDQQGTLPAAGRKPKEAYPPSHPMSRMTSSGSGTLVDSPLFSVPRHVASNLRPGGHGSSTDEFAYLAPRNQNGRDYVQRSPVHYDKDELGHLCHLCHHCYRRLDVTDGDSPNSGVRRSGTHKGKGPSVSRRSVADRSVRREMEEDDRRPSDGTCSNVYLSTDEGVSLKAAELEMSGGCCDQGPVNLPKGRARVQPT